MSMTAMGIGLLQTAGKPDGSGGFVAIPPAEVGQYTQAPLGFTHLQPASSQMSVAATDVSSQSGDRQWIYVYNATVATLTQGTVCIRGGAGIVADTFCGPTLAGVPMSAASVVGVVQHEIPAGFCGFILRKGAGKVAMEATAAANFGLLIGTAANGQAKSAATVVEAGFGYSLVSAVGAGLRDAYLDCNG